MVSARLLTDSVRVAPSVKLEKVVAQFDRNHSIDLTARRVVFQHLAGLDGGGCGEDFVVGEAVRSSLLSLPI